MLKNQYSIYINRMRHFLLISLAFLIACQTTKTEQEVIQVIPKPNSTRYLQGTYKLGESLALTSNTEKFLKLVGIFHYQLEKYTTFNYKPDSKATIELVFCEMENQSGYRIQITSEKIQVEAGSEQGIFYGLQTLLQLIIQAEDAEGRLQTVLIEDAPRFNWRGLMLDESRHFFGMEKVKQLLDLMALHKLNVFHWHLTDVPGWRIEIKKYPKLTTVGGLGNDIDPNAPARFYTQQEINEIVEYAGERFIEIIPEIDMPGHAKAANRAYPEFSGGGSTSHPDFTFNPGYDGTYTFLTNILREVAELFPSKYIHLGGDEVHYGNESWKQNQQVQQLMKNKGLNTLKEVESYFVHRMADSIKMLDKTVIGWDEIVDLNLDNSNSLVMWWRHDKPEKLKQSLQNNYQTILCPRIPLYFDFVQHEKHEWGRKWGGKFSTLELVYNFPPDTLPGFLEKMELVKGMQANIWTERIQNNQRLDFMTFPRLSALAEATWTYSENKNLSGFKNRLQKMLVLYDNQNIYYYNPFEPDKTPEPVGVDKRKQN